MRFVIVDRDGKPLADPDTGVVFEFATRQYAEQLCIPEKGERVVPLKPSK